MLILLWTLVPLVGRMQYVNADTPADCRFEDVVGTWKMWQMNQIPEWYNCSALEKEQLSYSNEGTYQLLYPNVVLDEYNRNGTWTLVYNQGFEMTINNRVFFAFFNWEKEASRKFISKCDQIRPGWAHDIHGHDWKCTMAKKLSKSPPRRSRVAKFIQKKGRVVRLILIKLNSRQRPATYLGKQFQNNRELIKSINAAQDEWEAAAYEEYESLTNMDLLKLVGGPYSGSFSWPKPPKSVDGVHTAAALLPENFDWRNVSGVNYLPPVRNQGACGSCYAFASVDMLESRYRILTRNRMQPEFSVQDILDCSSYAQDCDGGFAYLVAGKHANDFGLVESSKVPYRGKKGRCKISRNSDNAFKRYYSTDYHYVGGYFGAGNEDLIKLAVRNNGPVTVGIMAGMDFVAYRRGIYRKIRSNIASPYEWDPLTETNHAVTIVGYGVDKLSKTKYWIGKNSWGKRWGENGYFRIVRGTNEIGIESLAFEATPIVRVE